MHLPADANLRLRLVAVGLSLAVGFALMALKFYAAYLTGSSAILSDALESIINVAASSFALVSVLWAARYPGVSGAPRTGGRCGRWSGLIGLHR